MTDHRWSKPYRELSGIDIARRCIEFFEPDTLVEAVEGAITDLGWNIEGSLGLPRSLPLARFYREDSRGEIQFEMGVDITEVMQQLYEAEYKFERRHKEEFSIINDGDGDVFFDVVGGRYPVEAPLKYIQRFYEDVFEPQHLNPSPETATKLMNGTFAAPLWVTRQELDESSGRGLSDHKFYVFDPTCAEDLIDYWNYRLIHQRVTPINLNWFAEHASAMREHILAAHQSIPGNPFGSRYHTGLVFGGSIADDKITDLLDTHLRDLPQMAFYVSRDHHDWQRTDRGAMRSPVKIIAKSETVPFDVEIGDEGYATLPAPAPKFANATGRYTRARWANLITPRRNFRDSSTAIVYPSNLWSPDFPRIAPGEHMRIGREGWVLQKEHSFGSSLLRPQNGRDAICGWLKTQGIEARPSEEGQIAAQVIEAAGGLHGSGMFADRATLQLLGEMAEGRSEKSRNGKDVATATPDRSKHINTIQQHFAKREKRSFGYWNELDYFLKRSVFRAGLRVRCPHCSYQNWIDVDAISYEPKCLRCLKSFAFSQAPGDLRQVEWFYRVIGPFAAPDFARGGYAVALTLRCIAPINEADMTWSTGLRLEPLKREVDFAAWYRPARILDEERDEPTLVVGEAKSFGINAINDDTVAGLQTVAVRFPGSVMVVSTLREIHEYTAGELERLRGLARWGRRDVHLGQPMNPLIVLTATELFSEHGIASAWKKENAGKDALPSSFNPSNLYALSDLTQERYLGLPGFWTERFSRLDLSRQRDRLLCLIKTRAR